MEPQFRFSVSSKEMLAREWGNGRQLTIFCLQSS